MMRRDTSGPTSGVKGLFCSARLHLLDQKYSGNYYILLLLLVRIINNDENTA